MYTFDFIKVDILNMEINIIVSRSTYYGYAYYSFFVKWVCSKIININWDIVKEKSFKRSKY